MNREGLLLLISGPSGVGKDTIISTLMAAKGGMAHSISLTTRPPRGGEQAGVDYYFTDKETFERLIADGEVLEYDVYCGHCYGTPAAPVRKMLAEGIDVLVDLTIKGAYSIIKAMPDAVSIFLLPPSTSLLEQRLRLRGTETVEEIAGRLEQAKAEIGEAYNFDYMVVNEDVEETIQTILSIYEAERHRSKRLKGLVEKIKNSD
jgi:guanylate kinase